MLPCWQGLDCTREQIAGSPSRTSYCMPFVHHACLVPCSQPLGPPGQLVQRQRRGGYAVWVAAGPRPDNMARAANRVIALHRTLPVLYTAALHRPSSCACARCWQTSNARVASLPLLGRRFGAGGRAVAALGGLCSWLGCIAGQCTRHQVQAAVGCPSAHPAGPGTHAVCGFSGSACSPAAAWAAAAHNLSWGYCVP
jgi:hypothetical protein